METSKPLLTNRFIEGFLLAAKLHETQVRKGSEAPYLSHLMAVASIVLEGGGTEDEAIGALLHDAVEDQGGRPTLERIRDQFGDQVARIVEECSDTDQQEKPDWWPRKKAYIAAITSKSKEARFVSLADKIHNARSVLFDYRLVGEELWSRFRGGQDGTLWYYRTLVTEFRKCDPYPDIYVELVDELDNIVTELEELVGQSQV